MTKTNLILGFIGLGQMGMPLAKNLAQAGYDLLIYDANSDAMDEVSAMENIDICASIQELVGQVDVIFTCLPHENAIRSVYFGSGGIADTAKLGLMTCDFSTATPELVKQVQGQLQGKGGLHFDSPVFGGRKDAENGNAYFVFSGPETAVDQIEPFLNAMGKGCEYVGESSSASLMKILQNSLGYGYAIVTAEILTLCTHLGADAGRFARLVNDVKVMGWSKYFDLYAEDIVAGRKSDTGRLHIAAKDTQLLESILDQNNFDAPVLEQTVRLFREASEKGMGQEEFTAVTRLVAEKNRKA